jgi:membrane protease YdiL (CAAX protease family)
MSSGAQRVTPRDRYWALHVPAGLAIAIGASILAARAGASTRHQGLQIGAAPRGIGYGIGFGVPAAVLVGFVSASERSRGLHNPHATKVTARRAAYELVVRIPLGTALPEELIFRGALLGILLRRFRPATAAAISSGVFGMWHIIPTMSRMKDNERFWQRSVAFRGAYVAMMVAATTAAGFLLAWLCYASGSITAPWLVHSAANSAGFAAAWYSAASRSGPDMSSTAPGHDQGQS